MCHVQNTMASYPNPLTWPSQTTCLLNCIYCIRNKLNTFCLCTSTLKPILQKLFLFCYYVVCYYVKTTFFQVFQVLFSSNGAICLVVGENKDGVQKRRYFSREIKSKYIYHIFKNILLELLSFWHFLFHHTFIRVNQSSSASSFVKKETPLSLGQTQALACLLRKKKCRNCGHTNPTVFNSLFCIQPHYHQLYHLKLVHHLD